MQRPEVFETPSTLRKAVDGWRANGESVALVPTMGALHEGHIALVKTALASADRTIVSIFVNPTQFGPNEDFTTYPRGLDDDLIALAKVGDTAVYAPTAKAMYPEGFQTSVQVGELAAPLCGQSRPHFFGGVATVVTKLLLQTRPDRAIFGEKDFQQLLIVKRLVLDLDLDIDIIPVPTMRHDDGLAMSSRNMRLSTANRQKAPHLSAAIKAIATRIENGDDVDDAVSDGLDDLRQKGVTDIDYLDVRRTDNLYPLQDQDHVDARVFIAAFFDGVRLIDNWPVAAARP